MVAQLLLLLLLVHQGTVPATRIPVQDRRCPLTLLLPLYRTSELRNKRPPLFPLVCPTRLRRLPRVGSLLGLRSQAFSTLPHLLHLG